jgi:hypothetical protein
MSPVLGIIASSNQQGRGGGPVSAYDALATVTLSATASTVTFAGIPTGYQHLQIRSIARQETGGLNQTYLRFNGDTGNNYSSHTLVGDGSTASTAGTGGANQPFFTIGVKSGSAQTSGIFGASVTDILDYAKTNKNKTARSLAGVDANGSGYAWFASGAWYNTSAVTTITLNTETGNFAIGSTFALYGVK